MARRMTFGWTLLLGLASTLAIVGGTMWLTQRARNRAVAPEKVAAAATIAASPPVLDRVVPAQVETATFSMG